MKYLIILPFFGGSSYSLLLAVGRIILLTTLTNAVVSPDHKKQAIDLIQAFLANADQSGVGELLEYRDYNWSTIVPFMEPVSQQQGGGKSDSKTIKKLFFFALIVELPRKRILQLVRKNESMWKELSSLRVYAPDKKYRASYDECLSKVLNDKPIQQ